MAKLPEHLLKDSRGNVYWKGIQVEHYSFPDGEAELLEAQRLAARCCHLEAVGVPLNTSTAIWYWSWFRDMDADHPYKAFLSECFSLYAHRQRGLLGWVGERKIVYWDPKARRMGHEPVEPDSLGCYYQPLVNAGWVTADAGQGERLGVCYATTEGITALLRSYGVPEDTLPAAGPTRRRGAR